MDLSLSNFNLDYFATIPETDIDVMYANQEKKVYEFAKKAHKEANSKKVVSK